MTDEKWFTIDDIELSNDDDKLYCIAVDSPTHQFQIGTMGVPTHNTDQGKADDELKGEAQMIIGSIARLGRAAGVHLVVATQRPDAKLIPGETRDNLAVRLGCGVLQPSASQMLFASNVGQRVRSEYKGGIYLQIHGKGNFGQGFFAPAEWLDEYYKAHPDEKKRADKILIAKEGQEDSDIGDGPKIDPDESKKRDDDNDMTDDWNDDMDSIVDVADDNKDLDKDSKEEK